MTANQQITEAPVRVSRLLADFRQEIEAREAIEDRIMAARRSHPMPPTPSNPNVRTQS